ncbi:CAAP1 family protein [Megaselia abdita]
MTKVPAPLKVKQEDEGVLHPMSFYIDDRVELVKQVFASLKPKTIKNLAPSFLKKHTLEEIEEICLNDLLGISSKRLRSIIEETQCPSDTDSSSDSDVDKIEDHISLEEISSDDGDRKASKAKKLSKKKHKGSSKKDKDSQESSSAEKSNKTKKDLSVLELLELQARARAIRSQLALEPVTKIEVDSDDDDEVDVKKPIPSCSRKVVLNRDFGRQNSVSEQSEPPEKKARSPSPDIIPILPSTVTLCISDSEEEDNKDDGDNEEDKKDKQVDVEKPKEEVKEPENVKQTEEKPDEDSDRDDVISIGEVDIIDLDNSDDNVGKTDETDWNSRWLSSNKVSKVLSSAKLGKKLRDKVKEKKSKEKREKREMMEKRERDEAERIARKKAADKIINSKEEGTLEQFRILKEMEKKK